LFQVAGRGAPASVPAPAHVAPALLRVLDRLEDTPALILSSLGETLAQNRMAKALLGDKTGYTGLARSEIYRWFTDPAERERYPEDDRGRQKASPEFAGLWERHEVAKRFADHKILIHRRCSCSPPPHTEGYEKLRLLAVIGQQDFAGAGPG